MAEAEPSFLERHEFLIRRLHSLSGLIPVGAFMCVHLAANASVMNSPGTFQNIVYQIHSPDKLLPLIEWVAIFLPLMFHAIIGVWIIKGGLPNSSRYRYGSNIRYTLQRVSGMIAMFFILYHVFHMHGWFHAEWWLALIEPLGGHQFRAFNATSTAGQALQNPFVILVYLLGIVSCVFHLTNGLWTMGITWGVWTSPASQKKALVGCSIFGVGLLGVALSGLFGMSTTGSGEALEKAKQVEDQMYESRVESGAIAPNAHKRVHDEEAHAGDFEAAEVDEADSKDDETAPAAAH